MSGYDSEIDQIEGKIRIVIHIELWATTGWKINIKSAILQINCTGNKFLENKRLMEKYTEEGSPKLRTGDLNTGR